MSQLPFHLRQGAANNASVVGGQAEVKKHSAKLDEHRFPAFGLEITGRIQQTHDAVENVRDSLMVGEA
jgi:hypothetical protein